MLRESSDFLSLHRGAERRVLMAMPVMLLGLALAIGLLIGLERGWAHRKEEPGSRVAGIRTFGILGLLGGVALTNTRGR